MAGSPEAFQSDAFQNDAFQTGVAADEGGGGGRFDNLSRGMLVVDEEAWEEEGVILPLTLDTFP